MGSEYKLFFRVGNRLGFGPVFEVVLTLAKIVSCRPRGGVDSDKPRAPMTWMQRLKRVFMIDIETCPRCGGKLRVIVCINDPQLIRKVLGHIRQRDTLAGIEALMKGG